MQFSTRKAEYIRDLARAVAGGRLDLDGLAEAPSEVDRAPHRPAGPGPVERRLVPGPRAWARVTSAPPGTWPCARRSAGITGGAARSARGHPPPSERVGSAPDGRGALPAGGTAARAGRAQRGEMKAGQEASGRRNMNKKVLLPLLGQPDPNAPEDVHLVGRYAVGVTWADRTAASFPSIACAAPARAESARALDATAAGPAWPQEITRTPEGLRVTVGGRPREPLALCRLRALCQCAGCTGGH